MADPTRSFRPDTLQSMPETRRLISSLFGSLPSPPPEAAQFLNPLKDAGPVVKNVFLALHVIFPNELLPALDVLDRGLVLRLRTLRRSSADVRVRPTALLLVRSAQQQRQSHLRNPAVEHVAYYEVRLDSWSCSCPTFAFSAFPAQPTEQAADDDNRNSDVAALSQIFTTLDVDKAAFRFGGCSRGDDLPVCKHILACTLVEHCAAFAHLAEDREVTEEEMAGWAAGWGD